MSLAFSVLGSGSRGNCSALRAGGGALRSIYLVDCGLSPRATGRRLEDVGLRVDDVAGILLTHLDTDHFHRGWVKPIRRDALTVHVHERHRTRALRAGIPGRHLALFRDGFDLGPFDVDPVALAHDHLGTVGFVLTRAGARLGFATDLGRVPRTLHERFVDLHALAIESNYDPLLQRTSDRPDFLKRRIMGGAGHLSNEESIAAVERIAGRSALAHVVPLHLSQQCNRPHIVQRLYQTRLPRIARRMTLSHQDQPTPVLEVEPGTAPATRGEQMLMFDAVSAR